MEEREHSPVAVSHYVLGFALDGQSRVLLRLHEDAGPEAVRKKWNGLGGKIEPGESAVRAMRREFREESGGLDIAEDRWQKTITLTGSSSDGVWQVVCFRALLHGYEADHIDRIEQAHHQRGSSQLVTLRLVKTISGEYGRFDKLDIVPNLQWLVPLHALEALVTGVLVDETPATKQPKPSGGEVTGA